MSKFEIVGDSSMKFDEPDMSLVRGGVGRGQRANYIWQPFIDEEGNGCCTNVLTGETYLDWTKEELEND